MIETADLRIKLLSIIFEGSGRVTVSVTGEARHVICGNELWLYFNYNHGFGEQFLRFDSYFELKYERMGAEGAEVLEEVRRKTAKNLHAFLKSVDASAGMDRLNEKLAIAAEIRAAETEMRQQS